MATPTYLDKLARDKRDFVAALDTGTAQHWVVAVGNEAGDLDSLASALAYAHFAAQREPASSARRFVPLVLTARTDLHLRPENVLALEAAGVTSDLLVTIDDLPKPSSPPSTLAPGASFALVDHNSLLAPFRSNPSDPSDPTDDARVASIVDHHADEGRHLGASPRRIEVTGSCASLVADHFLGTAADGNVHGELDVPTALADLLLSSIMIDTRLKLVADGGKATPLDVSALHALLPLSSFATSTTSSSINASSPSATDPPSSAALAALKAHNDRLGRAKEDVAHLSARDLLRRDYKEYLVSGVRYGLSTVPLALSTLLEADPSPSIARADRVTQLVAAVRTWMDERELDMAGVLTSYVHVKRKSGKEGKHRREFALVLRGRAANAAALEGVFETLEGDDVLELKEWKDASEYGVAEGGWGEGERADRWRIWQQGNDRATRKQVAPSMKGAVELAVGAEGGEA
ncbi:uncharacterized protein RHOBADRAFT_44478 [Rhodotorula graminis WP1]|uniref:DHHA2 domain-containing protein n=1 Tax=Rhodotorula graminis (strain WP1) TaxID=578459 RepID=A0A194S6C1_RHOGW|nr:uncharacterized protein RHOBADRAFT_44478 [Rhodotorula graminis WP1]KPV74961.1 hypothetical protein RHOBADRAFT_44478 [Rhodotorula graminis WP1]